MSKSLEVPVLLEYEGIQDDREIHNTASVRLFVDPEKNRIGVRAGGELGGLYYVPLSDVLDLLRKLS